eukprot:1418411-Rhodomonas_salina.3
MPIAMSSTCRQAAHALSGTGIGCGFHVRCWVLPCATVCLDRSTVVYCRKRQDPSAMSGVGGSTRFDVLGINTEAGAATARKWIWRR